MVSTLAYCSQDSSLNLAGFFTLLYEKTDINEKEAGVVPLKNTYNDFFKDGHVPGLFNFFAIRYSAYTEKC